MVERQATATAEGLLERSGVRATQQRVRVLVELIREPDDATAQQLHGRLRSQGLSIGLATVYRTLAVLGEHGVVDVLNHRPGELCYRLCGDHHHHHLVCESCHRVVELGDCDLDGWLDLVAADHGFVTTGHRLEVAGLCRSCRPPDRRAAFTAA